MHRCHAIVPLAPPLCELQHSRSLVRQFLRQTSRWKMLMKSPKIHRVLVYTDEGGILGWWTYGFMSPTPQSAWRRALKNIETWAKNTVHFTAVELQENVTTSHEIFRKMLVRAIEQKKRSWGQHIREIRNPATWNHIFQLQRQSRAS